MAADAPRAFDVASDDRVVRVRESSTCPRIPNGEGLIACLAAPELVGDMRRRVLGTRYGGPRRHVPSGDQVGRTPRSAARAAIVGARTSSAASCCYPALL